MDTSISKALIMIAGVLLAMLVIAFATKTFIQMGGWATTQDQEQLTEQVQKFNKEYEAYDKDLMYGVDVISCLNKVLSNNERITNHAVINGETYDESYEVKVALTLKKDLEESIIVYHIDKNSKEVEYMTDNGPDSSKNVKISDVGFEIVGTPYFTNVSNFNKNDLLKTSTKTCKKIGNIFELTKDKNGNNETTLRDLLSCSATLSEIKKNTESNLTDWSKAVFRPALYDLKTRKFKCTGIEYNSDTGRVSKISFKEF